MESIIDSLDTHVQVSRVYLAVELLYHRIGKCSGHNVLSDMHAYTLKCIKDLLRVSIQNTFLNWSVWFIE